MRTSSGFGAYSSHATWAKFVVKIFGPQLGWLGLDVDVIPPLAQTPCFPDLFHSASSLPRPDASFVGGFIMSRQQLLSLVGLCVLPYLAACGADSSGDGGAGTGSGDFGAPSSNQGSGAQPGTLTAGDWDDNLNFDIYQDYVANYRQGDSSIPIIPTEDRIIIKVVNSGGDAISNALVKIEGPGQTYFTAPTASDGRVLFFPTHDGAAKETELIVSVDPPDGQAGVVPVSQAAPVSGSEWTITLPNAQKNLPQALDLAFVVDATGSMGDELNYLKVEMQGIADRIKSGFAGVSIRYALVMYRDVGDEYETRKFDFTSDIASFKSDLQSQMASGGGDFPEAMDAARNSLVVALTVALIAAMAFHYDLSWIPDILRGWVGWRATMNMPSATGKPWRGEQESTWRREPSSGSTPRRATASSR